MLKAGDICRVKSGRFTGLEVKIVEKIPKNGVFRSIWTDRLRNWVNVSGTITLDSSAGPQDYNFQASLQVATLAKLDKSSARKYNGKNGESIAKILTKQVWADIDKLLGD